MSPRRDDARLDDILAAISAIDRHLARGGIEDDLVLDACRVRIIEIGEAVKAIDADLLKTEPAIPWREIAKMRDVLAHHYFGTDDEVVAQVVKEELAPLRDAVIRLREQVAGNETAPSSESFDREGVRLSYCEFGGSGSPMLLLHGLAGYAGEWVPSANLLQADYRVFGLDQRGHGDSARRPGDLSRAAFVEDCAATIRRVGHGPVTLVGHSMGASTAMLTAAAHPELVRSLVVIEGSPDGPDNREPDPDGARQIEASLSAWPVPFPDSAAARTFFESNGLDPVAWTAGLETRPDGLWPKWDVETLVACMADLQSRSYWPQWRSIQAPTLVIFGEHGMFAQEHGEEIVRQLPGSTLVTVPSAGHDVHLDAPNAWVEALRRSSAR